MSTQAPRRPGELAFAVLMLVFSLWLLWEATGISGFSGLSTPGIFPMLASGLMVVSALAILRKAAGRRAAEGGLRRFLAEVTPPRQVVMLVLVGAYVAAMPWLGFLLSSGLFLLLAIQFLWRRNIVLSAAITAVSLGAIYLLFRVIFQVVLPKGTLFPGLF